METTEKYIDVAKEIINKFKIVWFGSEPYTYKHPEKFYTCENGKYIKFFKENITEYLVKNYPQYGIKDEKEIVRFIRGLAYAKRS